ncbi:MAG: ZPR1 zinc finger domain-containing protein [Candidatus Woesearchaeota archaeon]
MEDMQVINGELCPFCGSKTLTLVEEQREIPYFGQVFLFSMSCSTCKYHKADIESAEKRDPVKITFPIESEDDLTVRVVKSASATVKFPRIITMESTEMSNGYVTNIEGLLKRVQKILESTRDTSDDANEQKQAKNHLKKIQKILWGHDKITITIEDPTGVSAIISDKTQTTKLKSSKK